MDGDNENVSAATTIAVSTAYKDSKGKSHISIEEFLNFLKTAYQIQESVEGVLMSGGLTDAVNWLKKKETQNLLKENSICCQTSETVLHDEKKGNYWIAAKSLRNWEVSSSLSLVFFITYSLKFRKVAILFTLFFSISSYL